MKSINNKLIVKKMLPETQLTKLHNPVDVSPLTSYAICEVSDGFSLPILWINDIVPDPKNMGEGIIKALEKANIILITK